MYIKWYTCVFFKIMSTALKRVVCSFLSGFLTQCSNRLHRSKLDQYCSAFIEQSKIKNCSVPRETTCTVQSSSNHSRLQVTAGVFFFFYFWLNSSSFRLRSSISLAWVDSISVQPVQMTNNSIDAFSSTVKMLVYEVCVGVFRYSSHIPETLHKHASSFADFELSPHLHHRYCTLSR